MNTPLTTAAAQRISASGVDWHHSATLMRAHAEELELHLREQEAGAAAMREALEALMDAMDRADKQWIGLNMNDAGQKRAHEIIQEARIKASVAQSTDAGRKLLDKVKAAEGMAESLVKAQNDYKRRHCATHDQFKDFKTPYDAALTAWQEASK